MGGNSRYSEMASASRVPQPTVGSRAANSTSVSGRPGKAMPSSSTRSDSFGCASSTFATSRSGNTCLVSPRTNRHPRGAATHDDVVPAAGPESALIEIERSIDTAWMQAREDSPVRSDEEAAWLVLADPSRHPWRLVDAALATPSAASKGTPVLRPWWTRDARGAARMDRTDPGDMEGGRDGERRNAERPGDQFLRFPRHERITALSLRDGRCHPPPPACRVRMGGSVG